MTLVETALAAGLSALVATGVLAVVTVAHHSVESVTSALTTTHEGHTLTEMWTTDHARSRVITTSVGMVSFDCVPRSAECEIRYRTKAHGILREVLVAGVAVESRSFITTAPSLEISTTPHLDVALVTGTEPVRLAAWTATHR